jgi:two-component system sensor histidine kinase YesM
MNKQKKSFFKRDFLINQLMQLYSALLILVSLFIMLGLSVYTAVDQFRMSSRLMDATSTYLDTYIQERNTVVSEILGEFTSSDATFESLRNYLQLSITDYFSYSNEMFRQSGQNVYLPNILYRLISSHPDIEEIVIQLEESKSYVIATPEKPYGEKLQGQPINLKNRLYFARSIAQPSNFAQPVGQVFVVFNEENVLANRSEENRQHGIDSFIYTSSGQRLYKDAPSQNQAMIDTIDQAMIASQDELSERLSKNFYLKKQNSINNAVSLVLLEKRIIWQAIFSFSFLIFGCGTLILFILLFILHRTFKRYTLQVKQIVQATQQVSQGNFNERIDTTGVQQELKTIAEAINQMTSSINDYIEDIYTLEVKQRDADMRALQAQINPHFLYNTLEYIRMYALSRQQEELADVVYAFSALLRNNTTQEKVKTLAEEVAFCEKYVYLYQMRYPDKIAYNVTIEQGLEHLLLPKFTLQPLVENYFVHGIDYQRNDNAISIKAFKQKQKIVIEVRDNGRGASAEQLAMIRQELADDRVVAQTSIGMKNVHERLRGMFGDDYSMDVESTENQGFKISIAIAEELLNDGFI